jgi:hypothetical protein
MNAFEKDIVDHIKLIVVISKTYGEGRESRENFEDEEEASVGRIDCRLNSWELLSISELEILN